MRISTLLLALCLVASLAQAQQKSCCGDAASCSANSASASTPQAQFASLASDANFRNSHALPRPFVLEAPAGEMVGYNTPDGKTAKAYVLKAAKATDKWLFVFHEWWGLNDQIKAQAEKFGQDLGVNVIALDMYDGVVANSREEAGKMMQGLNADRAKAIMQGAVTYVGAKAKIGTVGYCMGGGFSMQGSLLAMKQAQACVIYYGMPETDAAKLTHLHAPVLFVWPNQDKWINAEVKNRFVDAMKLAGKKLEVAEYTADHAFANPTGPNYNSANSVDAYNKSIAFFKAHLK